MEHLNRQAHIAHLRGDFDLSAWLWEIINEEERRKKEMRASRSKAVNLVLVDEDF